MFQLKETIVIIDSMTFNWLGESKTNICPNCWAHLQSCSMFIRNNEYVHSLYSTTSIWSWQLYKVTERAKHATDLARDFSLDYDALVLLSGDGLLHEVYNGFAEHDEPLRAFAIPLAPIPTGSANGMAINLLGIEVCITSVLCYWQLLIDWSGRVWCGNGLLECD